MKKAYIVYVVVMLVLCVAGVMALNRLVENTKAKVAAIEKSGQGLERSVTDIEVAVARKQAELAAAASARQAAEARAAAKASAEQAARITKALEAVAIAPKPVPKTEPQHWYTPSQTKPSGKVYTNRSFTPGVKPAKAPVGRGPGYVIIDFKPTDAGRLEWQEAVTSGRCAAFSFVNVAGKTIDRLYCDPVVAR